MSDTPQPQKILSREENAKLEIGVTNVPRRTAAALVAFFVLTILGVPAVQVFLDVRASGADGRSATLPVFSIFNAVPEAWSTLMGTSSGRSGLFAANGVLLRAIDTYETEIEDGSFVAERAIPRMQPIYTRWLGLGNEQAYPGLDGWLFYRPGLDYVTGRGFLDPRVLLARSRSGDATVGTAIQPDPVPAILEFHQALQERGIHLVVLPAPVKPMMEPELFSARYDGRDGEVLRNVSYSHWLARLHQADVDIFDAARILAVHKAESGNSLFLETDTHWKPDAMDVVAEKLAAHLAATLPLQPASGERWTRGSQQVLGMGDITAMLKLPADQKIFSSQEVTIAPVQDADGAAWQSDPSAEVLLLGDSFANIYSLEALGWGSGAGLAEQLAYHMQRPVDAILRNDAGSHATREILARELTQGTDRLAGKKVVVWQFAERELSVGDWKQVPLPESAAIHDAVSDKPGMFFVPDDGTEPMPVAARVLAVSPVPRPGSVPYRDHIFAVHLGNIQGDAVPQDAQAMVYLFGMKDNLLTSAASWRVGDAVQVTLRSWNDVSAENERFNRSELDDPDLQFEMPVWGETTP